MYKIGYTLFLTFPYFNDFWDLCKFHFSNEILKEFQFPFFNNIPIFLKNWGIFSKNKISQKSAIFFWKKKLLFTLFFLFLLQKLPFCTLVFKIPYFFTKNLTICKRIMCFCSHFFLIYTIYFSIPFFNDFLNVNHFLESYCKPQ